MQLVRLLPDGHKRKREVDMALDCVSETMTPMHYHLREIIISTYRQVQRDLPAVCWNFSIKFDCLICLETPIFVIFIGVLA